MVYNGKPFKMDNLGVPPFKETPIYFQPNLGPRYQILKRRLRAQQPLHMQSIGLAGWSQNRRRI